MTVHGMQSKQYDAEGAVPGKLHSSHSTWMQVQHLQIVWGLTAW